MALNISNSTLSKIARVVVCLWVMAQIAVIVYRWNAPVFSDAANYYMFATEAFDAGSWYPTAAQMNCNAWIANTGYINFLVANLYVFGTFVFVAVEQLLLNCLLLFSIWKLAGRFADRATASWAVIVYCVLPSNILCVTVPMSDLFCISLFMASAVMMRRNGWWLLAAGAVAALANWARPVGMIYWPSVAILGWLLTRHTSSLRRFAGYAAIYIAGVVAVDGAIMALTYSSSGVALAGSTTKGTNMIMGCNDDADGAYNDAVFAPGKPGYIAAGEMDAVARDKELTRRSVEWVLAHPARFVALAPVKVFRLWCGDYYNNKIYQNGDEKDSMTTIALFSLTYYAALLLSLFGIWKLRRSLWGYAGAILLPVILGTGLHVIMYGGMRYHYPMMPSVIFFAAVGLNALPYFFSRGRITSIT